jgi:hypothetical protein
MAQAVGSTRVDLEKEAHAAFARNSITDDTSRPDGRNVN